MTRSPLSLAIALLALATAQAQPGTNGATPAGARLDGITLHRWSTSDGLPTNTLSGVAHDADGYLWITSNDGLVRFDGHRMTVFNRSTTPDLPTNRFSGVVAGPGGALWFHSGGRYFVRYADGAFAPLPPATGSAEMSVLDATPERLWIVGGASLRSLDAGRMSESSLVEGRALAIAGHSDGRLWIGTDGQGLIETRPDGSSARVRGLPSPVVPLLHLQRDGTLWAGTDAGLVAVRDGQVEPAPPPLDREPALELAADDSGRLWVKGSDQSTWVVDDDRATQPLGPFVEHTSVHLYVAEGRLWVARNNHALRSGQLFEVSDGTTRLAAEVSGIIAGIAQGPDETLWLATTDGLYHLRRQPIETIALGGIRDEAYGVVQRRDGSIWVATAGRQGVSRLDPNGTLTILPSLPNFATSFVDARDGSLWAGSRLCRYQGDRCVPVWLGPNGETAEHVYALFEDSAGRFWAGSEGRLWRGRTDVPTEEWTSFPILDELPQNRVQTFFETRGGDLLMGTDGSGVLRVLPPLDATTLRFETLGSADGLASDHVRDIHEDAEGVLWIATEDRGLCRLDRNGHAALRDGDLACLDSNDGLHSNSLHRLIDDGYGRLWINSNQGLFWVETAALDAWARGERKTVPSVAYSEADGLPEREGNGGVQSAGIRARDGRLWFPTMDGMAVVTPSLIHAPTLPQAHVETVWVVGEQREGRVVRFGPSERDVTVGFTAPAFARSQDVRFQYRLRGFVDGWQEGTGDRRAVFTNLPPGRYTFEVRAGLGGAWSQPATIVLQRRGHLWEAAWFPLVVLVALLGLGAVVARRRVRRAEDRQRELEAAVAAQTDELRESRDRLAAQADALQRADELKTRFLANVSHEFRTPLTLTFGPIDDLLDGEYTTLDEARPHFERARRNGGRLLRLINQLLDLSRLGAGALRLQPVRQPVGLGTYVGHVAALFTSAADQAGVTLDVRLEDDDWTHTFDADVIEKIVVNLLSNAFKFTPEGGTVTLSLRSEPGDIAVLAVADTGIGIADEHLGSIFDRFYQVESGATRSHEGSGVGLALVKELAELHGGTAEVESEPGEGTRFTISLPRLARDEPTRDGPAADPPPVAVSSSAEALRPEDPLLPLVLVVEDNSDMRDALRGYLSGVARVAEAADGEEGLTTAREIIPDLVVSDVMMPRMDGLALCDALKTDVRTSHIPVALLSARADVESRISGYETGADAYLPKPFQARELRARVAGLLRERERLRERLAAQFRPDAPGGDGAPPGPPLDERERAFLADVDALIHDHLGDATFTTDRLASELALSRRQLQRKLQALTDESPGERIRRMRLRRASDLLHAGQSVKETAAAVGFKSDSAFGRAFRQAYDVPPSSYARDEGSETTA